MTYPPLPPPAPQPTPPRRGSYTVRLLAAVVAFLLVAAGALWLLTRGSDGAPRIALPQSFRGYQLLHNDTADRLKRKMADRVDVFGLGKAVFDRASVGAYAHNTGDQPALIVLVLPRRTVAALGSGDHDQTVRSLLDKTVPVNTPYPSGSAGGVLRCGTARQNGEDAEACAWSDARTAGVAVVGYPPVTTPEAATLINNLRGALR